MLVRAPRVRIPPPPPMCDKCIKRAQSLEIVNLQTKIDRLFQKIDGNPLMKEDFELVRLLDIMAEKVAKYREK